MNPAHKETFWSLPLFKLLFWRCLC